MPEVAHDNVPVLFIIEHEHTEVHRSYGEHEVLDALAHVVDLRRVSDDRL